MVISALETTAEMSELNTFLARKTTISSKLFIDKGLKGNTL